MKNKRKNMKKKVTSVLLLTAMLVSAIVPAAVSAADDETAGNELKAADILDLSIDVEEQTVTNGSTDGQPIVLSTDSNVGTITCEYDRSIGMNVAKIRDSGYVKFDYATDAKDYTTNLQDGFTLEAYFAAEWEGDTPTGSPLSSWIQGGFGLQKSSALKNAWYLQFTSLKEDETENATTYYTVSAVSGQYVHVVLSYDGKNCAVYVDGELVKNVEGVGKLQWRNDSEKLLFLGASINYGSVTKNHIDTNVAIARIYDDALSAENAATLYDRVSTFYNVTFDSCGGSVIEAGKALYGGKVTEPTDVSKSDYTLEGWYTDSTYTSKWDFATDVVSGDMTLYAKWTKNGIESADILDLSIDVGSRTVTNGSTDGQPIVLSTDSNVGTITCEYDRSIGMNVAKIRDSGYVKFDYATDAKDYTTNLQDGFTLEAYFAAEWEGDTPTGSPLSSWIQGGFGLQKSSALKNAWYLQFTSLKEDETENATTYYTVSAVSGQYVHVVLSYDGKNCAVYVDGELVKNVEGVGKLQWRNDSEKLLFLGASINYGSVTKNHIDTNVAIARIYDDALDKTDVTMLYNDVVAAKKAVDTRPMLNTKYQMENNNEKYNIRFVSSMDNYENYQEAGFVFSIANDNPILDGTGCVTKPTEKLYTSIMADGEAVDVQTAYGEQSNHMYAFEIKNVPAGTTIYTRAYIKLTDGTIIYGDLREMSTPNKLDYKITLETPVNASTVSLINEEVTTWMSTFNYTSYTDNVDSLVKAICLGVEEDYYQPVSLSWSLDKTADYYVVTYATDSEFSDAKTVTVKAESTELENLYVATDYYWYVTAYYGNDFAKSEVSQFTTKDTLRVVTIEGVNNTRDLGGVTSSVYNNIRLKQGKIYRTAKLDQITVTGRNQALNDLGIKFDLDLRNPDSDGDTGTTTATIGESSPLGTTVKYQNISSRYYTEALYESNYTTFASELALFADESNYPICFHCSAGRDRTGTLGVLLYGLLGVDVNTIYKDYCTTYLTTAELDSTIQTNCLEAFVSMINEINGMDDNKTFHENVEALVLKMGVTQEQINSIREIMLGSSYATEEVVE